MYRQLPPFFPSGNVIQLENLRNADLAQKFKELHHNSSQDRTTSNHANVARTDPGKYSPGVVDELKWKQMIKDQYERRENEKKTDLLDKISDLEEIIREKEESMEQNSKDHDINNRIISERDLTINNLTEELERARTIQRNETNTSPIQQVINGESSTNDSTIDDLREKLRIAKNEKKQCQSKFDKDPNVEALRRELEGLRDEMKLLSNTNESAKHLEIYIKRHGPLNTIDFMEVDSEKGFMDIKSKQFILASWNGAYGRKEQTDSVMSRINQLTKKKKNYDTRPEENPNLTPEEQEELNSFKGVVNKGVTDRREFLTKKQEEGTITGQESKELSEMKEVLGLFTNVQLDEGIDKHTEIVEENMSIVETSSKIYKKYTTMEYIHDMSLGFFDKIRERVKKYIPIDFLELDTTRSESKSQKIAMYAMQMIDANEELFRKLGAHKKRQLMRDLFSEARDFPTDKKRSRRRVFEAIVRDLESKLVKVDIMANLGQTAGEEVLILATFSKMHEDINTFVQVDKTTMKEVDMRPDISEFYFNRISSLVGKFRHGARIPFPTEKYVNETNTEGEKIHIGDTNPFEGMYEEFGPKISSYFYGLDHPQTDRFYVTKGFDKNNKRHREMKEQVDFFLKTSDILGIIEAFDSSKSSITAELKKTSSIGTIVTKEVKNPDDPIGKPIRVMEEERSNIQMELKNTLEKKRANVKNWSLEQIKKETEKEENKYFMKQYTSSNIITFIGDLNKKWLHVIKQLESLGCCMAFLDIKTHIMEKLRSKSKQATGKVIVKHTMMGTRLVESRFLPPFTFEEVLMEADTKSPRFNPDLCQDAIYIVKNIDSVSYIYDEVEGTLIYEWNVPFSDDLVKSIIGLTDRKRFPLFTMDEAEMFRGCPRKTFKKKTPQGTSGMVGMFAAINKRQG